VVVGYDVHVSRGDEWSDAAPISSSEWRAFVESSADLELVGAVEVANSLGETIRYASPDLAMWTRHPSRPEIPFAFRGGRVVVKNPDEATLGRLRELATSLGARVQGDDGEFHDEDDDEAEAFEGDDRFAPVEQAIPPRRGRFWRR
jgi:hypothetical protein